MLLLEIRAGRFEIGDILPSEVELAAQLRVSRGSVREALQILADGRIVERARKLGTRVLRKEPQDGYVQRLNSLNDALGFGGDTVMRIDDVRDVRDTDEPALQAETSLTGHWLQVTGARHLPDDADALTTWARVYVNGPLSGIRPMLSGAIPSIYKLIEQAYNLRVVRLRHRITAIALPDYAAMTLGLTTGVPRVAGRCLALCNRRYADRIRSIDP